MSILIVEDNAVNAKLLALMLKSSGYQTVLAQHGREALDRLSAGDAVQLIITDLMMPEMDGLEFVARVKTLPSCEDIPILLTSAHADVETVNKASQLGCREFLVKPVDRRQLLDRVERLLRCAPVTLRDSESIKSKLGIRAAEYHHLATVFAVQVAATIPVLQAEQGESEEEMSDGLKRLLRELAESAALIGAEKFLRLYERLKRSGRLVRSQCASILKVFQELTPVLKAEKDAGESRAKRAHRPASAAGAAPAAEAEEVGSPKLADERRQYWLGRG